MMTDDFRAGLHDLARETAERHRRQPGPSVAVIERAARRRRRRHDAVVAAASAAVLVIVAATGAALANRPTPVPATPARTSTPEPSATATPTPTPTPTPTEVRTRASTADPAEPDAWAMTEDTWGAVGPGWALAVHSTVAVIPEGVDAGQFDPAGTQALFLVAPDGTTYRLHSLPGDWFAQVMWWDPERRTAWVFLAGRGDDWQHVEVDLRDGSVTPMAPLNLAPVRELPDGRTLWAQTDPFFPGPVERLFWLEADGTFVPVAADALAGTSIVGDVWLDPDSDRVAFLTGTLADLSATSVDLTDDSVTERPIGAAPAGSLECTIDHPEGDVVVVGCRAGDWIAPTEHHYEVGGPDAWTEVPAVTGPTRLVHEMLLCGAPELPWSASDRVLPERLAAQGWSDAAVLPESPGARLTVPKITTC